MLAGPFLPDFLPFPLSVSWSSTHNCSINISHIFYFRELWFPAQVIKTFLCRCSTFHLCLLITTSTAPYAAHWCIIRIIQKYFVAQGSFCKMLPECFQLVWKLGSPPPQAECPAVFLCIPYFGHPTSPSPNLKAKTMRRFQVLNILPCFLLRTNPTVTKYITSAPKWKYQFSQVIPNDSLSDPSTIIVLPCHSVTHWVSNAFVEFCLNCCICQIC